jgi:hypothetical protein
MKATVVSMRLRIYLCAFIYTNKLSGSIVGKIVVDLTMSLA